MIKIKIVSPAGNRDIPTLRNGVWGSHPATYGVFRDDVQVAKIYCPYARGLWSVFANDDQKIRGATFATLSDARKWVIANASSL